MGLGCVDLSRSCIGSRGSSGYGDEYVEIEILEQNEEALRHFKGCTTHGLEL